MAQAGRGKKFLGANCNSEPVDRKWLGDGPCRGKPRPFQKLFKPGDSRAIYCFGLAQSAGECKYRAVKVPATKVYITVDSVPKIGRGA